MAIWGIAFGDAGKMLEKEQARSGKKQHTPEEIGDLYAVWKAFHADRTPRPGAPLTGHLQGKIDYERMMRIKKEIENREVERRGNGDFRSQ